MYLYLSVPPVITVCLSLLPSLTHLSSSSLWPFGYHSTTYALSSVVSGLLQEMVWLSTVTVSTSWGCLTEKKKNRSAYQYLNYSTVKRESYRHKGHPGFSVTNTSGYTCNFNDPEFLFLFFFFFLPFVWWDVILAGGDSPLELQAHTVTSQLAQNGTK